MRDLTAASSRVDGVLLVPELRRLAQRLADDLGVMVRRDAETSDIAALELATGLLTQRGARTSHAAVVARQLGKVCLVGCAAMQLDEAARTLQIGDATLHKGDLLTLDGNDGAVYAGAVQTEVEPLAALQARLKRLRAADAEAAKAVKVAAP